MTLCTNPDSKEQSFVHVCYFLFMTLMQLQPVETVAPNSPNKIIPDVCPNYKYLTEDEAGHSKCRRCSQCPKGFQVLTKCSTYNDTVCEQCPTARYNNVSGNRCKPCSGCEPGKYIRRECSTKRDTSCRPCPRYMFTVSSNSIRCMACRTCRRNEERLFKCNSSHDTVCGECLKGFFRVSSTGSCLQCSQCPSKLENLVVPECRDKLGINNPNICWPGDTTLLSTDFYDLPMLSDVSNGDIVQNTDDEVTKDTLSFTLIVCVLGTLFGGIVVIIIVFICFRQLLPTRYSSLHTSTMYEPSSIPLPLILRSTNESLDNSSDSAVNRQHSMEYTYFPSTDRTFHEKLKFEHDTYIKYSASKSGYSLQEAPSPRTKSEPACVNSSDIPVSFVTNFSNTGTQGCDTPRYFTDNCHFDNFKKYETL